MARPRTGSVTEGQHMLEWHIRQHQGTPVEHRLHGLKYIKEHPNVSFEEISRVSGYSARSLRRWLGLYRDGGIDAVIGDPEKRPGARSKLESEELEDLRNRLRRGEFGDLGEIQAFLKEEYGVEYSLKGISNLVRNRLEIERGWVISETTDSVTRQSSEHSESESVRMPKHIIGFLNSLPTTSDTVGWITAFRDGLQQLLPDVDRLTLSVNTLCELQNPDLYRPTVNYMESFPSGERGQGEVTVSRAVDNQEPADRHLAHLIMRGFPVKAYHSPRVYVYRYSGTAHLATLLLWREKGKVDISPATLAFMAEIEPFLVFMFSDLVTRHQHAKPGDRSFIDALAVMAQEAQLTEQERRAVILQLFGHSYQEIADRLHLSIDTVRKHVKNIYRKTGTGSYTELFAKYFTSRLGF